MPTGSKIAHLGLHESDLNLTHPGRRKVVSKHASQIKKILREFNAIHIFWAQGIGYPTENWRLLKFCDGMWRNLQKQCIITSKVTVWLFHEMFGFEHHEIQNVLKYSQKLCILMDSWNLQSSEKKVCWNGHEEIRTNLENILKNQFCYFARRWPSRLAEVPKVGSHCHLPTLQVFEFR